MALTAATTAAIAVFRELGWEGAALEDVMSLPLGTPEQRRIAKAGLEKGEWGQFGHLGSRSYGWIQWIDVDQQLLSAFAIRQGVTARRAARLLTRNTPTELAVDLLVERGKAFVSAYVEERRATWSASVIAVAKTEAPPPTNLEYWEWWLGAAGQRGGALPDDIIELRFADHLRAGLRSGAPAPRDWRGDTEHAASTLVMRGVDAGWIGADEASELVLFAMDQAQRPSDRGIWASVLFDALQPDQAWLRDHASVLLSAMSFGDNAVIERCAPVLLRTGDPDLIGQAMLIGLTAKSAKAKSVVLEAAAAVPAPGADTVSLVAAAIAPLLDAKNRTLAKQARALCHAWAITIAATPTEQTPTQLRGLWQPTPQLAPVPRFDPGPVTADQLTALASLVLMDRHADALSVDVERFLATANALARRDRDAVRTALRGVKRASRPGLGPAEEWVKGEVYWGLDQPDPTRKPITRPLEIARDASVFQRLGEVPVLLSTPSWDDYRIDPGDLAERLDDYAAAEAQALEADLLMALPRIDLELLTDELTAALSASPVPIVLQSGSLVAASVGQILRDWMKEPLVHPGFTSEQSTDPMPLAPVAALASLPARFANHLYATPIAIFPTWPQACIVNGDARPALVRHRPNGAVPSTQLLNHVDDYSEAVSLDATIAAWQAGVLLPGVAQVPMLGWGGRIPSIAARAERWSELAHEGLLSVIWPVAHDVVCFASRGARPAPGVDALVELLHAFLPEVQAAISAGLAPESALDLPGVRALAERTGSSRAVAAAKALTALLPPLDSATDDQPESLSDKEFSATWPTITDRPVVHDGASLEVQMQRGAKGLYPHATVILADGSRHVVGVSWLYPLRYQGQLPVGSSVWLYQSDGGVLVAGPERQRPTHAEGVPDVTHTLATLALLSQQLPKEAPSYDLQGLARDGLLGPSRVAAAIEELSPVDGFDPYRVVRWLTREPAVLPAFYPVLTRSIRYAAALPGKPPTWLVRIIDVATELAPVLRKASARGLMLADDASWPGLDVIATSSSGSPTARRKAAALLTALGLTPDRYPPRSG